MNATPSKDKPISRRSFLGWLVKGSLTGSALLGLDALARFINFESQPGSPTQVDLGLASDYPLGSRTAVSSAAMLVIHTMQGFSALSLVCPHLGCTVRVTEDGFTCPCHGSRYLPDGSLRNGPASRPLNSLRIEVNPDGHLVVYLG
jgi:cytochrome b6-f complex iron-sulfur subunit